MNVDWMFAFTVVVTGILVVFMALVVLIALIYAMSWVISLFTGKNGSGSGKPVAPAKNPPAPKAAPKANVKAAMQVEDGIGDEVIAVISAAIAALMSAEGVPAGSYAVKSVRKVREARPVWAMAGMHQNTKPF